MPTSSPVTLPPKTTRSKAAAKKVSKKKRKRVAAPPSSPPALAHRKEINPEKLSAEDAKKRVAEIYRLEADVEKARQKFEISRRATSSAKKTLRAAEERLEREIQDQRFGAGPLFPPKS